MTGNDGSLFELEKKFLENLKLKGKSPNTLKNYKTDLECFNYFLTAQEKMINFNGLNSKKVKEYDEYLHIKYASSNSRRRRVQTLRLFFDFLIERNIFTDNPIKKIAASPKFLDIPRPSPLLQIEKLWNYLQKEADQSDFFPSLIHKRNQIIVLLIYEAGLKVSDLEKLKVSQILLGGSCRVLINPIKRDPYTIPLSAQFEKLYLLYLKELKKYEQNHPEHQAFEEVLFNANPFCIISGGLSARGQELLFKELSAKLKIQVTPKSLRQSCIFKWLHLDIEVSVIKEWMGVAPMYSMKLFQEHMNQHIFKREFSQ